MKIADKEYSNLSYAAAIRLYEQALQKEPGNMQARKNLADSYRKIRDNKKAEKAYEQLIVPGAEPEMYIYYAQALAANGKYEQSKLFYQKYAEMAKGDSRGKRFVNAYNRINSFFADSLSYQIYYTNLNSAQSDFSPMYYKNGLVFVSNRITGMGIPRSYSWNQTPFLNLYYLADTAQIKNLYQVGKTASARNTIKKGQKSPNYDDTEITPNDVPTLGYYGKTFSKDSIYSEHLLKSIKPFSGTLNTKYHEGPVAFFDEGKSMIFTRNNYNEGKYGKSSEGINKLKLYSSSIKNGVWSDVKSLPFNSDQYSVGHPTLSPDNKRLYFVSDMPGGKGGSDIYVCHDENGVWSSPKNISALNTEGNEMFPFADPDGNLYFSSDGWPGLGELDIFYSRLENNVFTEPVNLGFPINTDTDDFGFICEKDRKSGFFSSNRRRNSYDDDIYRFNYVPLSISLDGIVLLVENESPIDSAWVTLKIVNGDKTGDKITTKDGKFDFQDLKPETDYEITTVRKGFVTQKTRFTTKGIKVGKIQIKIYMDRNIHFALDGTVTDRVSKNPIVKDTVTLRNIDSGEIFTTISDKLGKFHFELEPGSRYEVAGNKEGNKTNIEKVSTKGRIRSETLIAHLYMSIPNDCDKLKRKYFIENIYFDLDKSVLRPDAIITLDKVVRLMHGNQDMRIDISSHTDARGSNQYNELLSHSRSKSVIDYLLKKGIRQNRLSMNYHGEDNLLNKCADNVYCPETEQQRNRRTEFFVFLGNTDISSYNCTENDLLRDAGLSVMGKIYEEGTKAPIANVKVTFTNHNTQQKMEMTTGADGGYYFKIPQNCTAYTITASSDNCGTNQASRNISGQKPPRTFIDDIGLLCEGDIVEIENVYYDLGKYYIRNDAAKQLDKVVELLKRYPKMTIEVRSHTDSRGSAESNKILSENRAKAVVAYLITKGISSYRTRAAGYGESVPVNRCSEGIDCTELEHQMNRRTEFKILTVK